MQRKLRKIPRAGEAQEADESSCLTKSGVTRQLARHPAQWSQCVSNQLLLAYFWLFSIKERFFRIDQKTLQLISSLCGNRRQSRLAIKSFQPLFAVKVHGDVFIELDTALMRAEDTFFVKRLFDLEGKFRSNLQNI